MARGKSVPTASPVIGMGRRQVSNANRESAPLAWQARRGARCSALGLFASCATAIPRKHELKTPRAAAPSISSDKVGFPRRHDDRCASLALKTGTSLPWSPDGVGVNESLSLGPCDHRAYRDWDGSPRVRCPLTPRRTERQGLIAAPVD